MSEPITQTPGITNQVSQREVANRLGISVATVSMALRDHPRIPVPTRERVKRMAEEMGYLPVPLLRNFSHYGRTKRRPPKLLALGWINAWPEPEKLAKHHEYGGYWRGASQAAFEMGYHLEEFRLHPQITLKELNQRLRTQDFRGLLLPPDGDPEALKPFPWEKYHVVSLSHHVATPATHLVGPDRVGNCSLAFEMMRNRGYRRIGFLTRQFPEKPRDNLSIAGFLSTQWTLPEKETMPVFTLEDHPLPHQLSQWVAAHRPDAILTDVPDAALLLKQAGLRVPQDVGLAFCCPSQTAGSAGIDCHPEEVGRLGLEMLKRAIGGYMDRELKIRVTVNGHWRNGRTLPVRSKGD